MNEPGSRPWDNPRCTAAHERFADLLAQAGFDEAMITALRDEDVLCADETPGQRDRQRRG